MVARCEPFFLRTYEKCYLSLSHHDRGEYVDGLMEIFEHFFAFDSIQPLRAAEKYSGSSRKPFSTRRRFFHAGEVFFCFCVSSAKVWERNWEFISSSFTADLLGNLWMLQHSPCRTSKTISWFLNMCKRCIKITVLCWTDNNEEGRIFCIILF